MTSLHVVGQYVSAGCLCLIVARHSFHFTKLGSELLKTKGVRLYESLGNTEEPIIKYTFCLKQETVLGLSLRQIQTE